MSTIVTLLIQNREIRCNRWDLIKNSDYFKAMFEGNFLESSKSTITLHDVDGDGVEIILKILYQPDYIIQEEYLLPVLQASQMLQFQEVNKICIEKLLKALSYENCLKIWFFTEQFDLEDVSLKARLLALLEFSRIIETSSFVELALAELKRYLGDCCLFQNKEDESLKTILQWYQHSQIKNEEILNQLINFTHMERSQIEKIIQECGYNIQLRNLKFNARSINRNNDGLPCILLEHSIQADNNTVVYSDNYHRKRKYTVLSSVVNPTKKFSFVSLENLDQRLVDFDFPLDKSELVGFKITGYKQYIFIYGGEYLYGHCNWNQSLHVYNTIKENWSTREDFPTKRRHFESCICGDRLYIIGGTGKFRLVQENFLWYNIVKDKWSGIHNLPCVSRQSKCCSFRGSLFLLNLNDKCGYHFDQQEEKWCKISIQDDAHVLPTFSENLTLFTYRDNIYIKDKKILKFKMEMDKLIVEKHYDLPEIYSSDFKMKSIFCNNILYTLVIEQVDDGLMSVQLETINLDDLKTETKYRRNIECGLLSLMFNTFHISILKNNDCKLN